MTIPFQIFIGLILHILLPLYFLGTLAFAKSLSLAFKISILLLLSVYLLFLAKAGTWQLFGLFWNYLFFGLYIIALVITLYHWNTSDLLPKNGVGSWLNLTIIVITFLVFLVWRIPQIYHARSFPTPAIELEFPLRSGEFLVTQGGNTSALNQHYVNQAQKFALDIVKIDALGFRADGFLPSALEHYKIFRQPIYSPCAGKVIAIEKNLPDLPPPASNSENLAGNYVLLLCKGYSILMAHMQQGSISVSLGQELIAGSLIGRVGNSGNTSEPHLHIHAVKGNVDSLQAMTQTADAVPMLFNTKFLIRNDRLAIK